MFSSDAAFFARAKSVALFCLLATTGGDALGKEQMHGVRLQYSGHLLFDRDEAAVEYEWQPRANKSGFLPEVGLFTGLGFTPSYDFFEVLAATRVDMVHGRSGDHHWGFGLIFASGVSTFEFNTLTMTPIRVCPYLPIGGRQWLINLEFCMNAVYSSLKGGMGVAYEF